MAALVEVEHNDDENDHLAWLLLANVSILVLDYVLRVLSTCECIQPGGAFISFLVLRRALIAVC